MNSRPRNERGAQSRCSQFSLALGFNSACQRSAADSGELQAFVQLAVEECVAARMGACVRVSAFLSAGIDSGALAGWLGLEHALLAT